MAFIKNNYQQFIERLTTSLKKKEIKRTILVGKGLNKLKSLLKLRFNTFLNEIKLKLKKKYKFKEKKKIDYHILNNIAMINKNTDKSLAKKSRTLKIFNFLIKYQKFNNRSISLNSILLKFDFFQRWQTKIILEKGNILISLDNIQNQNFEISDRIKEIDENNEIIEGKIRDITTRAEKCDQCRKFLGGDENNTSFLNASMTASVKFEDTNTKINPVTNVSVKKLIHDKGMIGSHILTSQDDIVESEFKNKQESPSDFFLEVSCYEMILIINIINSILNVININIIN